MMKRGLFAFAFLLIISVSVCSAEDYQIDIKIDKQTYVQNENLTFTLVLLKDQVPFSQQVEVVISDALEENTIKKLVQSNEKYSLPIEPTFSSGYWKIVSTYNTKKVSRIFWIEKNEDAEFTLTNDLLIIKNVGNTPYTKTINILIGEKAAPPQKLNIPAGDSKEIRLIAPSGNYNIEVRADEEVKITKQDLYLEGTGNVVGAIDKELASGDSSLGGARDPKTEDQIGNSTRNPLFVWAFLIGVFSLGILMFVERFMRRKLKSN